MEKEKIGLMIDEVDKASMSDKSEFSLPEQNRNTQSGLETASVTNLFNMLSSEEEIGEIQFEEEENDTFNKIFDDSLTFSERMKLIEDSKFNENSGFLSKMDEFKTLQLEIFEKHLNLEFNFDQSKTENPRQYSENFQKTFKKKEKEFEDLNKLVTKFTTLLKENKQVVVDENSNKSVSEGNFM